jgi:protein-tyrosine phosphatase|uniref:low molecular weight protein-tyrosine-phosphatase n=1 Tax=Polaribacter sp. TaxID=1920175 RepID=UPI004047B87A
MQQVLMVCLGNICRSPLAEGILQSKVDATKIRVDSAGTAAYHVGELPDNRSIEVARKHGIDLSGQRARKFTRKDFDIFDVIYAMDLSNYNSILDFARNEADQKKVHLILNEVYPKANREVPDPYYGGLEGFEQVFQLLEEACILIEQKLQ